MAGMGTPMAPAAPALPVAAVVPAAAPVGMGDVPEKDLQTLQLFIENALDMMLKGNATSYNFLIQQLHPTSGKSDPATRRKIFLVLPRCISAMAKEPKAFHQLLDVLFKFDFLGARDEIDAYTGFLVHLVSSNTVYVLPALQMLVRNLCRPQTLPPELTVSTAVPPPAPARRISIGGSFGATAQAPPPPAVDPAYVEQRIQDRFNDVHETLRRVLKLAPTATNALFPVIVEHFPHKRLDVPFQVAYLRNVLALSKYVPGLQERIFALVIDCLVAVDVEIKLDEQEEDVFTMDDFLDDDLLPETSADGSHVDEMADKLDHMMVLMFEHIESQVRDAATKSLLADQASHVFKCLLKVFEHSILNTHRSKYPQFLLFYVCQLDPQFQDVLISQLLSASLDPQTPPVTRHSCGAYLASFLARAKYISIAYIQKALYHLLKWMHEQMDVYDAIYLQQNVASSDDEDGDASPVKKKPSKVATETEALETNTAKGAFLESIYISTLQTVCYLVCFRGLELAQSENGYDFLRSLGWERLLITPTAYCPLSFCQHTVATEFLNFAELFDLVSSDCIDKVDAALSTVGRGPTQSQRVASSSGSKSMERTAPPPSAASAFVPASVSGSSVLGLRQPLETFFPFDPYLLRRSFKFIGPLYLYWKHADPTSSENAEALQAVKEIIRECLENEDNEDEGDENDGDESDEDDDSLSGAPGYDDDDAELANSLPLGLPFASSFGSSSTDMDARRKRRKHGTSLPSRATFAPSPALSASSPPSQLPSRLDNSLRGFALSGFDDQVDDDGF